MVGDEAVIQIKNCFQWDSGTKCIFDNNCTAYSSSKSDKNFGTCCCTTDYCNSRLHFIDSIKRRTTVPSERLESIAEYAILRIILCAIVPLIVLTFVIAMCYYLWRKHQLRRLLSAKHEQCELFNDAECDEDECDDFDLKLSEIIAHGRYGKVYRAEMNGKKTVAVKMLPVHDYESWRNEKTFYKTSLPHPHICHFIGACKQSDGDLCLVTELYPFGSLYDYLKEHTPSFNESVTIWHGIASGLVYLHHELKPAVAHRDMKSKNVLLRSDLTPCIADFGLALRLNNASFENAIQVGTRRYMSPEVLQGTIKTPLNEAFKRIDIYAVGLIIWEIAWRTSIPNAPKPLDYRLPFEAEVGLQPLLSALHQCVVLEKKKPETMEHWNKDRVMRDIIVETILECMDEDEARPSALTIHSRFERMKSNVQVVSQKPDVVCEETPCSFTVVHE
ncbi:unnamed protein product [Dimorphilus gyrociliatus]|uniref:Serine/threonine-protein kinase receptor n=1 Tax=Dimorphilus gyrociliatus TaxID=2664684 RepID=A0A7I8VHD6_9ANNE|nr:unnamed protein product [Dimorphilus gyrociliatus]